jgi:hypothetical protein
MFSMKATPRPGLILALVLGAFVAGAAPAHATTITDVVFVMASDGGIEESGWTDEVNFVQNAIQNILPLTETKVGLVEFSTNSQVKLAARLLTSSSQAGIQSVLSGLTFWGGYTYISDGVQDGIQVLEDAGPASDNKLMVLLSNGKPNPSSYQNPCGTTTEATGIRQDLAADNINVLEVMVGTNWSSGTLSCLVNYDSSRVVPIASAASTLSAILAPAQDVSSVPEPGTFGFGIASLAFAGLALKRRGRRSANAEGRDGALPPASVSAHSLL